jgi:hypothetical protein
LGGAWCERRGKSSCGQLNANALRHASALEYLVATDWLVDLTTNSSEFGGDAPSLLDREHDG